MDKILEEINNITFSSTPKRYRLSENEELTIRPKKKVRECANCGHINPVDVTRCEDCSSLICQL